MNRKTVRTIAFRNFVLLVALGAAWQGQAQDAKGPYPSMAPLDQYLMADRDAEIALARTAARNPSPVMPRFWCWGDMAMKPRSEARMVSYAPSSEGGWAQLMVMTPLIFGTLRFAVRSALIRRLREPSCHLRTRGRR